ncbi:hypothetical protein DXM62_11475 [Salmonella enterica]|nr:hypothetical protein [Salmonella enterica]
MAIRPSLVTTAATNSITQKEFSSPFIKKTPTEAGVPCPVQPTKAYRTNNLIYRGAVKAPPFYTNRG